MTAPMYRLAVRRAPLALLALLGTLAAPASAHEYPGQRPVRAAAITNLVAQANAYWDRLGVPPATCDGGVVLWQASTLLDDGDRIDALGRGYSPTCEAWVRDYLVRDVLDASSFPGYVDACEVLTHEIGHARGLGHDHPLMGDLHDPADFARTPYFCIREAKAAIRAALREDGSPRWLRRQMLREIRQALRARARWLDRSRPSAP